MSSSSSPITALFVDLYDMSTQIPSIHAMQCCVKSFLAHFGQFWAKSVPCSARIMHNEFTLMQTARIYTQSSAIHWICARVTCYRRGWCRVRAQLVRPLKLWSTHARNTPPKWCLLSGHSPWGSPGYWVPCVIRPKGPLSVYQNIHNGFKTKRTVCYSYQDFSSMHEHLQQYFGHHWLWWTQFLHNKWINYDIICDYAIKRCRDACAVLIQTRRQIPKLPVMKLTVKQLPVMMVNWWLILVNCSCATHFLTNKTLQFLVFPKLWQVMHCAVFATTYLRVSAIYKAKPQDQKFETKLLFKRYE